MKKLIFLSLIIISIVYACNSSKTTTGNGSTNDGGIVTAGNNSFVLFKPDNSKNYTQNEIVNNIYYYKDSLQITDKRLQEIELQIFNFKQNKLKLKVRKKTINKFISKLEKEKIVQKKRKENYKYALNFFEKKLKTQSNTVNVIREKKTVHVKNAVELLNAIKSNTSIILTEMVYNISVNKVKDYINNPNVSIFNNEIVINDVFNIDITNVKKFYVHIYTENLSAPVLTFINCNQVELIGLKIGHKNSFYRGGCEPDGDVLNFQNCNGVNLESLQLYGCGVQGLNLSDSNNFNVISTTIYDCTDGILSIHGGSKINFDRCTFKDNYLVNGSYFTITNYAKEISFNNCKILNNKINTEFEYARWFEETNMGSPKFMFYGEISKTNIELENITFSGNEMDFLSQSFNVLKIENSNFNDNNKYRTGKLFKN